MTELDELKKQCADLKKEYTKLYSANNLMEVMKVVAERKI